jgi:ABC-type transport system substrate-binding protein
VLTLLLISLLVACAGPATTDQTTTSVSPATTTAAATTTTASAPKPQGELIAAVNNFGSELFIPWLDPVFPHAYMLIYDMLIYWDYINEKFLPGLAESWDVSVDGMTTTFHLRQGIQFQDGWGELTSADVKYTFEMQASPKSIGKTAQTRRIASMDTPDPYTLVVHMKNPYHTFFVDMSMGNSGVCQGIVCKKYLETVGEEVASQKPIGTGPFKLIESNPGNYMKFEALDSHWRVVPEFKNVTLRLIPETSTLIAALKTGEVDLAQVPADQLSDLKTSGLAVEVNPVGGTVLVAGLGGMVIPEDTRYDPAIHNKDPWSDPRVRKAMAMAIDRQALCDALLAGFGNPASVPLYTAAANKYQYPYDPAAGRQLLKDAGYPDGFSFRIISSVMASFPGAPQVAEALAGYWQQIGLKPEIATIDYNTYLTKNIGKCQTAGDVWLNIISVIADELNKAETFLMPNVNQLTYSDTGSFAIYRDNPKSNFEERNALVDKLNQYYFDNVGPIPLFRNAYYFAWNSEKISPFIHEASARPLYLEYVRHAQPLNTFRLFNPWPGR